MKKSDLRSAAPALLKELNGWDCRQKPGKGVLPNARLIAKGKVGKAFVVAVRALDQRSVSFSRLADGDWRTLSSVKYVLVLAPAKNGTSSVEALLFTADMLVESFDKAWQEMLEAGRPPAPLTPIFVPLDNHSKKNIGHNVGNLTTRAIKEKIFSRSELKKMVGGEDVFGRVRQELADRLGVDVEKVDFEFRIQS